MITFDRDGARFTFRVEKAGIEEDRFGGRNRLGSVQPK